MNFIDGVTLIENITVPTGAATCIMFVLGLIAIVISVADFKLLLCGLRNHVDTMGICILGLFIASIATAIAFVGLNITSFEEYVPIALTQSTGTYKVVVDNRCNMNEFHEKYEIIDYDNGCYIISIK